MPGFARIPEVYHAGADLVAFRPSHGKGVLRIIVI